MEKHAVTPGPIVPAREQLGELLVAMGRPAEGLTEYEAALAVAPNRFNGLYGAGVAARDMGDMAKAREYFRALVAMCDEAGGSRPELDTARSFIE
jgi:tetratricopeptide (TPR) repeat protein